LCKKDEKEKPHAMRGVRPAGKSCRSIGGYQENRQIKLISMQQMHIRPPIGKIDKGNWC
jgi:hypothetical protein